MSIVENLPSIIGQYRLVRKLGEGGMGAVYEAIHQTIGRRVAIKILHADFSRNPEIIQRFFNEARAVNIVEHPGLVQISDYGQLPDGTAYIVMEYLKGETLAQRMASARGPLPHDEVLQIGWQIADSLAAAHEQEIVHRDLKPDNVMLVADPHMPLGERAKLLDFGIAKISPQLGGSGVRTRSNMVMGTPRYMSPEQCRGAGTVDTRSDVYSLGVMLFQMLAGRTPFEADAPGDLMVMHLRDAPPSIQQLVPDLSSTLVQLIDRLLLKDPASRPSMREVTATLLGLQSRAALQHAPASSLQSANQTRKRPVGVHGVPPFEPAEAPQSVSPTTLISATGQSLHQPIHPRGQPRFRRTLLMVISMGAILSGGLIIGLWLSNRSSPQPTPARLPVPVSSSQPEQHPAATGASPSSTGSSTGSATELEESAAVQPAQPFAKKAPDVEPPPQKPHGATATPIKEPREGRPQAGQVVTEPKRLKEGAGNAGARSPTTAPKEMTSGKTQPSSLRHGSQPAKKEVDIYGVD